MSDMINDQLKTEDDLRFLVFKIGDEYYGSPLLSIREVLEYQKPKPMPNMVRHFSGVVNIRGAIVGVIDLKTKFNYPTNSQSRQAMLLCDTEKGPLAAVVDVVESVILLQEKDFEKQPPVKSTTNQKYILGVAKNQKHLVTIIDLHKLLLEEELKAA